MILKQLAFELQRRKDETVRTSWDGLHEIFHNQNIVKSDNKDISISKW